MTEEVVVTIGRLGEGEREVTVAPGESVREVFEGPGYVAVDVPGRPDGPEEEEEENPPEVADTTFEQDDGGDGREWKVPAIQCRGCGQRYPKDYSRCPECGNPNQN